MSVQVLLVCRKHYIGLVIKGKVGDYLPASGYCQMVGCNDRAVRRVLIGEGKSANVAIDDKGRVQEEGLTLGAF